MRQRTRGFSLIELTAVLTVLSLVWLSITCILYTLYRADHRLRDELQREHAIDRFTMRLRLDSHAATSARLLETPEGSSELVLSAKDDRKIHYSMADEGLRRVVREGELVVHRDTFLTGRSVSQWRLQPADDPSLVVLTVTSRDKRSRTVRARQIKAAVALANRTVLEPLEESP